MLSTGERRVSDKRIGVFLNVRLVRSQAGYSAEEKYVQFWLNLAESFEHLTIFAPTRESSTPAKIALAINLDKVTICELPNYLSSFELYAKYFKFKRECLARAEDLLSACHYFVAVVPNAIGLTLSKVAERKGIKTAFYIRGNLPKTVRFEYQGSWKRLIAVPLSDLLHRITMKRACRTLTFVVGEGQAAQYGRAGVRVWSIITSLIRETDIVPARTMSDTSDTHEVIVSIGRLSAERGIDVLLNAMAKLKVSHSKVVPLRIIGDGPERESLQRLASSLGLEQVTFEGFVSDPDTLKQALLDATLMVVASHTEGLPKTVLESLASGCPLVTTAVGGIPQLVRDEKSALIVAPDDPQALANAMVRVLTNPALAAQLSEGGRAVILRQTFEVQRDLFIKALIE